ncbi:MULTISPECIES: cell wall metabolism sensor histidine kinase WalK [unclassified Clostridium]|uniref:sensor histidine kinase n=1 Tax=Clostridium TaxID=1485 RepID=UPI001C8BFC86|nr:MULTISPECIES: HAMP domain-containing sensor histidine kinase [unclassified Clostridium]MBX9139057.1 HAMP domain-containing protein [Clostridium sp. K12(2020)]MBX9145843.1 HAMP domain-containing protein [Clostridium sp. K13]
MKNRWKNLSIKKKLFIWSSLIIIFAFTLLYICIYFFMPRVYEIYKVKTVKLGIEQLKTKLEEDKDIDIDDMLDNFSYNYNLDIILVSKDKDNLIDSILYSSFREGANSPNNIPFLYNHKHYERFKIFQKYNLRFDIDESLSTAQFVYQLINKNGSLNIDEAVYIKSLDKIYHMIVHFPISPENEAEDSIVLFFPFAIIAIIVIAFTISSFYAILISKPLIKINKVAKKMAKLDFDNVIEINGEDEIGELSNSLNLMNKNLKESFKKLEKMNSQLTEEIEMERKLEKERREFVATISHELKSPITIINGQLEGMIYNIGKYKDRDKYLKESYEVTQKMSELVQEILHLSERENGEFKYNFTNVNISKVTNSVIRELKYFIDEKNLELKTYIDEDVFVNSDEKLIKKAITNTVKNAITHSPLKEKIIIKLTDSELSVENTGITIPKDQLGEIFNAFYRVDKSRNRKTGGTGLGLYIVRTILDKHENIQYTIESSENSVLFKMKFSI